VKLGDLLPEGRIMVPLPGRTLHDAAEQLVAAFVETGLTQDGPALIERIGETPPRSAVNVGDRAFIQTIRSDAVTMVGAALGVTADPIALDADSEPTASVVVLLVGPFTEGSTFIQTVSSLDRQLGRDEVIEAISSAETRADVLAVHSLFEAELPGHVTVADVMARRPRSVWPDATLDEAARAMLANRLTSIPVTSRQGEVVGLLTYRAMLGAVLPRYVKKQSTGEGDTPARQLDAVDPREIKVREVMDKSVLCLSEDQTLADVASVLTGKAVGRFPVVRDGMLIGVLNRQDIVRRLFGP
jgi:CBS domain-containing protein